MSPRFSQAATAHDGVGNLRRDRRYRRCLPSPLDHQQLPVLHLPATNSPARRKTRSTDPGLRDGWNQRLRSRRNRLVSCEVADRVISRLVRRRATTLAGRDDVGKERQRSAEQEGTGGTHRRSLDHMPKQYMNHLGRQGGRCRRLFHQAGGDGTVQDGGGTFGVVGRWLLCSSATGGAFVVGFFWLMFGGNRRAAGLLARRADGRESPVDVRNLFTDQLGVHRYPGVCAGWRIIQHQARMGAIEWWTLHQPHPASRSWGSLRNPGVA